MNTRSQISRGNKLFLPKIEYAKLAAERSFSAERPNIKTTLVGDDEKSNSELEDGEKVSLLNRDNSMGPFTRFSVLPPIKDSIWNARRMSRTRRFSSGVSFASANGPPSTNRETNRKGDEGRSHKYVEFSSLVAQQRRDSNSDNGKNLQVVGRNYARGKRKTRETDHCRFKARTPQRSFSSPVFSEASESASTCKACQTLLTRKRSKTEGETLNFDPENPKVEALAHTCKKNETVPGQFLRRFNSDNFDLQSENRAYENSRPSGRRTDLALSPKQSESANLSITAFPNGRRPVSRCEINVDVNLPLTAEHETQILDHQQNIARPSIRVEGPEIGLIERNAQGEKNSLSPQGSPQIQILIDSLEIAREEIPKAGSEVPYTSVREKRRRSALCRNNSKQVDDFLLVHNLRDLGLL